MKKHVLKMIAVLALVATVSSCKGDKANEATITEAETVTVAKSTSAKYIVSANDSKIDWKGFKPGESHNGTLNIESGTITVNDGVIESGSFLIDMKSITVLDIPADKKGNANLKKHLSAADFFDIEKFPNAAFDVTGSSVVDGKTILSGNLSIKGIKNNIKIPVSVATGGDEFKMASEAFTIDRTKWGIKFKSKSVFGDLGDKFINDDIELKLSLIHI